MLMDTLVVVLFVAIVLAVLFFLPNDFGGGDSDWWFH